MSPFCVILSGFFIVVIVVIVATIRFPLSCCRNKNLRDNMPKYSWIEPKNSDPYIFSQTQTSNPSKCLNFKHSSCKIWKNRTSNYSISYMPELRTRTSNFWTMLDPTLNGIEKKTIKLDSNLSQLINYQLHFLAGR